MMSMTSSVAVGTSFILTALSICSMIMVYRCRRTPTRSASCRNNTVQRCFGMWCRASTNTRSTSQIRDDSSVSFMPLSAHACSIVIILITRLLGRPQPQMYPPVALNQYTLVNRTHKHYIYMLQGPTNILKSHQSSTICKIWK